MLSVSLIIGMFRHNACHSHRVRPDGIRAVHMKDHCTLIHCLGTFQHSKIVDRAAVSQLIVRKSHVLGCELFSVREISIRANFDRPGQSIFTAFHLCGKVITDFKILICNRQSTLNQRFMNMLAGSPSIHRVKT